MVVCMTKMPAEINLCHTPGSCLCIVRHQESQKILNDTVIFKQMLTISCHQKAPNCFSERWKVFTVQAYKFWRGKVQRDVKTARTKYFHSVAKLKDTNPSRWWNEIKSLGGFSYLDSWYQQLLSEEILSCVELTESYKNFLVRLTAHFQPLDDGEVSTSHYWYL